MRVVFASNSSWYLVNFRRNTILSFLNNGLHVSCIAPYDEYSSELQRLGANFIELPVNGHGTNIISEIQVFWSLLFTLRRIRPVMVFNFTIKLNVYGGVAAKILGLRFINNVSGLGTVFLHKGWKNWLIQRLYFLGNWGAETVFFQNGEDRHLLISEQLVNASRSKVIPGSGVDLKRFKPEPLPRTGAFTFLMVGRLMADKGVREFVSAAQKIRRDFGFVRFILIGQEVIGSEFSISRAEVAAWKNEGVVEIPGPQKNIEEWIKLCHVFVLPSYREGMPKCVMEAAAIGRPAIVSDVPGCRQSITPGHTGWLCKPRSADSLERTMRTVLSTCVKANAGINSETFVLSEVLNIMADNAVLKARSEFDEEIVIEMYLNSI